MGPAPRQLQEQLAHREQELDVQVTVRTAALAAREQQIAKIFDANPGGIAITRQSDRCFLAEVLKRLLDNAVQFTPAGGQIGLEAHPGTVPGAVDLAVWDTGISIPAGQLDHVFHAFTQADGRLACSHEGLGLGLAYVARMVRLLGGTDCAKEYTRRGEPVHDQPAGA